MSDENYKEFFSKTDDALHVDLWYPRNSGERKYVRVGLVDVRAADGIRIEYDFDRDGWSICQQVTRDLGGAMEESGDWREVFFAKAWALETRTPEQP